MQESMKKDYRSGLHRENKTYREWIRCQIHEREKKEERWFWNFRHPYVKLTSPLAFGNLRIKFAVSISLLPLRQPASTLLGVMYIFYMSRQFCELRFTSSVFQPSRKSIPLPQLWPLKQIWLVWYRFALLSPGDEGQGCPAPPLGSTKPMLLKADFSFVHFLTISFTSHVCPFLHPCHSQIALLLLFSWFNLKPGKNQRRSHLPAALTLFFSILG